METLKYRVIKNKTQYNAYCKMLEQILEGGAKTKQAKDEVDLLTLLIEKWDEEHNTFDTLTPVELLVSLMKENQLKAKDLVGILDVSKGLVSDILNYKKGMSKDIIRALAGYFKVSQEAFNRPYGLDPAENARTVKRKRTLVHA